MAAINFALGVVCCASLIFIPSGLQFLKIARFAIWPFDHRAVTDFDMYPKCNLLWAPVFGWWQSLIHLIVGVALCITIVGIPFGRKCFRLSELSLIPYGAIVV